MLYPELCEIRIAHERRIMASPTFVSLYTGAGGLDIGFIAAGFKPVFSNDINADAMNTYSQMIARLQEGCPDIEIEDDHIAIVGDIRGVQNLPERGSADLVIGGPPCQGFSVAGKMDPNDPRSRHVFDFLAMVERVQPKAFVMENVKALAIIKKWQGTIRKIREEAERIGYATTLNVLNAADFGVPQSRERMFLVGIRDDCAPDSITPLSQSRKKTVRDALDRLPAIGEKGNDQICTAKVTAAKNPVMRKSPWAGMLFNGQGRPMNLDAPAPTLPASMGGNRTPIIDQQSLETGEESWAIRYHRHLMEGGDVAAEVPDRMRRITVDEAASIQTFPLDMPWQGSQSSRYRQIGNAVPPKLAYAVAKSVARSIDASCSDRRQILEHLEQAN